MPNPDGMFLCRIPPETAETYGQWTDAVAFRFVKLSDEVVEFQVSNDLELVTRPDGEQP